MISVAGDKLPTGYREMCWSLSFDGTIPAGAWAYDTVTEWMQVTEAVNGAVAPLVSQLRNDPGLFDAELEHLQKAQVCWRDIGLGALVQWEDIKVSAPEQARALQDRFAKLGRRYVRWLETQTLSDLQRMYGDDNVILSSGKGPPYFFPGLDADAAVALARLAEAAANFDELDRFVKLAGGAMVPMSFVSYLRCQGARKARPNYILVGNNLTAMGEKLRCKVRRVQAAPFHWNYLIVGVASVLKGCMRGTSNMNSGTVNEAVAASKAFTHTLALDFSHYDESVAVETLTLWRSAVYEPVLRCLVTKGVIDNRRMHILLQIDEAMQIAPQLGPPRHFGEAAVLGGMIGSIRSGERLTSQKGTDIARELNLYKMEQLGVRGELFNQGDDTIICTNDGTARKKFEDNVNFLATEQTVAPDASYLMKRIPGDYAYFTRMVYANINKEPRFEARNLFHAAGAMWVRRQLLKGHPLESHYYNTLRQAPGRLRYTATLAESTDGYDLLSVAAALTRPGGGEESEVIAMIERAAAASGREDLLELASAAQARASTRRKYEWLPPGTQQMRLRDFRNVVSGLSFADASEWIATHSYKKRAYRIW